MRTSNLYALIVIFTSCSVAQKEPIDTELSRDQIISQLGQPLPEKEIPDSVRRVLQGELTIAKERLGAYPDSIDLVIWYGRRTAYLGRYLEAIDIFSKGLEKFPNSYRLLRHRGHRYISTRQLDKAIVDLDRANELSLNATNAIEPDGIPNSRNQPLGNDKFNIYYHQGLAYYVKGEFEKALPGYLQCIDVSDNDDLLVATSYWLYMTYHRLGMQAEATELLANISEEMEIVENAVYGDLLLLFKGDKTVEDLLTQVSNSEGVTNPTAMYGIGNYYFQIGDSEKALEIWQQVLKNKSWDAFGYIAAEAEITLSLEYLPSAQ